MTENLNDQRNQQLASNSGGEMPKNSPALLDNTGSAKKQDAEDWDVQPTYQRRPQFRINENNRRRNYYS